jgi:Domain of unknown function (DUF4440)
VERFLRIALILGITWVGTMAAVPSGPVAAADDTQALLQADQAFAQAFDKADKAAAGKLLDTAFTWTDATGKISTRALVLQNLGSAAGPKLAISGEGAQSKEYTYGAVGVVQVNDGKMHVLRVWVKRPVGWQALVYQEVKSLDAPLSFTPGAGAVCENPCKSVPYRPKTPGEKDVVASYEALETAAVAHNAADWSAHVADEFAAVSSNSDQQLDKPGRMAGLEKEKMGGVSPTPLVSARMFDFGDAVVMTSRHKPDHGNPLHITRVWIKRDGKWVETLSYQTAIVVAARSAAPK